MKGTAGTKNIMVPKGMGMAETEELQEVKGKCAVIVVLKNTLMGDVALLRELSVIVVDG